MAASAIRLASTSDSSTDCDPQCSTLGNRSEGGGSTGPPHINSAENREQIREEYYRTYEPLTGVRIAATLGGFFGFICLMVLYKTKCKPQRDYKPPAEASAAVVSADVEMGNEPPLFEVNSPHLSGSHRDIGDEDDPQPCFPDQLSPALAAVRGFHSSYARFHAQLDDENGSAVAAAAAFDNHRVTRPVDDSDSLENSGGDSPLIGAVGLDHNFRSRPVVDDDLLSPEDSPARNGPGSSYGGAPKWHHRPPPPTFRTFPSAVEVGEPSGLSSRRTKDFDKLSASDDPRLSSFDNLMNQPSCSWQHHKGSCDSDDSYRDMSPNDSDSSTSEMLRLTSRPSEDTRTCPRSTLIITPEMSETHC